MVQYSLPGGRKPQSQAIALAVTNGSNKRSRIPRGIPGLYPLLDQNPILSHPQANADLPTVRHCFEGVGNEVKEHALHTRAHQQYLYATRHIVQDPDALLSPMGDSASDAAAMTSWTLQISDVDLLPPLAHARSASNSRMRPAARWILVARRFTWAGERSRSNSISAPEKTVPRGFRRS
jgi:hypothetical protein